VQREWNGANFRQNGKFPSSWSFLLLTNIHKKPVAAMFRVELQYLHFGGFPILNGAPSPRSNSNQLDFSVMGNFFWYDHVLLEPIAEVIGTTQRAKQVTGHLLRRVDIRRP
jgi:hypothetical protein